MAQLEQPRMVTPEAVALEFTTANVGSRILAFVIDAAIVTVVSFLGILPLALTDATLPDWLVASILVILIPGWHAGPAGAQRLAGPRPGQFRRSRWAGAVHGDAGRERAHHRAVPGRPHVPAAHAEPGTATAGEPGAAACQSPGGAAAPSPTRRRASRAVPALRRRRLPASPAPSRLRARVPRGRACIRLGRGAPGAARAQRGAVRVEPPGRTDEPVHRSRCTARRARNRLEA